MATNIWVELPVEGSGGGVTSLNGETGALTLVAGTGISITPSGTNITIANTEAGGTVTSVALADGSTVPLYSISGSPVTTSGTLTFTLNIQAANTVLAGPTSGGAAQPTFRSLIAADIGGFTSGSVIFAGSTGVLSQDNTNFFWNDTTFNLGLGVIPATNIALDVLNSSGTSKAIQTTSYGVGSSIPFRGRFARGTSGSPTAAQNGDNLSVFSGRGYGTSQFAAASTGAINIVAAETFTNTSNATYLQFETTPTGSVTIVEAARISPAGNLLIGTTTDSGTQKLQVTGNSNIGTVTAGIWNGSATSGQSFLISGTTYTTPSTITSATVFKITLVGGGASGAGTPATINTKGAGGGAGGVAIIYLTGLAPSTAYTYAIGGGGSGGSDTVGNAGGNTTISINAVTYTASGGAVASGASSGNNGGVGGGTTNATIGIQGGSGGAVGLAATSTWAGFGGSNAFGAGGASLFSASAATAGNPGTGYGSGGGGAWGTGSAAEAGGNGAAGMILIEWKN